MNRHELPKRWRDEIAAGTAFGKRAAAAFEKFKATEVSRGRALQDSVPFPERVGTALKSRIAALMSIKTKGGCGCNNLASEMDRGGIAWCEKNRQYIVDHLMGNRDMLADAVAGAGAAHRVIGWALHTRLAEPVLKAGAEWLLDAAIADAKAEAARSRPLAVPHNRNKLMRMTVASRPSFMSAFRSDGSAPRFITSQQFQTDIKLLLAKIPSDITVIAGVARSGLSVATMLAMYLQLPMITIRQTAKDVVATGNGWRLGGDRHIEPKGERVLVVDDTVMTGNSLKAIRPIVAREIGEALYATVYVNPQALAKPDLWAVDLPWPHLLEWNLFNSVLSPAAALDFDGILCGDCAADNDDDGERYRQFLNTAVPRYLPRKVPVPLIVTARLEKYRAETEAWLRRHRVQWTRLVMHPAKTLAERMRDDIAAYKARHYSEWAASQNVAPGPLLFIESDDRQARRIAELTRRMVVCPATAGVYL